MKKIPSIQYINNISKLNTCVFFESNVIDRDMTPLTKVQTVNIDSIKRHLYKVIDKESEI